MRAVSRALVAVAFAAVVARALAEPVPPMPPHPPPPSSAATWMSAPGIRDKTFGQITLPGTHDSGTAYLSSQLQPGSRSQLPKWASEALKIAESMGVPADQLVRRWARAQVDSVGEQLERGARYVDLRAGWEAESMAWRIHHALTGQSVDEILEEVKVFLVERPSEVVMVELSHFLGDPDAAAVERLAVVVDEVFGDLLAPFPGDTAALYSMKIGSEFVDKNRRCVVVFEDDEVGAKHKFWPSRAITNTYADSDETNVMRAFNQDVVRAFNDPDFAPEAVLKLSWTLTTQAKTILESFNLIKRHPKSLVELARTRANPFLSSFIADATSHRCSVGHIIVIDDFAEADVVDDVLRLNDVDEFPKGECAWPSEVREPVDPRPALSSPLARASIAPDA